MRPAGLAFASLSRAGAAVRRSVFLRETGWLITAKVVQGLSSILATLAVARHLGPSGFGNLSLAIATTSLVATIGTLGLEHVATRELSLASDPDSRRKVLVMLRRLRAGGAIVGTAILAAIALTSPAKGHGISGLLWILCLLPLAQVGDVSEWRLVATGHSKLVAASALIVSPMAALIRLAAVFWGAPVIAFAWILVGEWAVRSLFLAGASRAVSDSDPSPGVRFVPTAIALLRESAPLLLAGIAVFIYMRIDQFMIAAMLDARRVGLYSAIVAVAEAPLVLPALLLRSSLPLLTRQAATDPEAMNARLVRLMRISFYVHAVFAVGLVIFAERIVTTLYGQSFAEATQAFRILALGAPFIALGVISSAWLVIHRCTGHALRRTGLGVVTNVVLNLLLIPMYGIAGAALATLIAQIVATYAADACYGQTRHLFKMKSRAMLPLEMRIA